MMPESGPDEVVIIEEQVGSAPSGPASRRAASPGRIAGMVLGSLALGLAATAIAIRLTNRGRGSARRRGAPLLNFQPRGVFAPSLTITLPFSGISGQPARGRPAAVRSVRFPRRGRPTGVRGPSQATREKAGPRGWLPRSARRLAAR